MVGGGGGGAGLDRCVCTTLTPCTTVITCTYPGAGKCRCYFFYPLSTVRVNLVAAAAAAKIISPCPCKHTKCQSSRLHSRAFVLPTLPSMFAVSLSSAGSADTPGQAVGIDDLIQQIVKCVPVQPAPPNGAFKFAIDHCFAIRGQGTILTGTALSGTAKIGDALELPELKVTCHTAWCPYGQSTQTDLKHISTSNNSHHAVEHNCPTPEHLSVHMYNLNQVTWEQCTPRHWKRNVLQPSYILQPQFVQLCWSL